jgi:hypothetical protein
MEKWFEKQSKLVQVLLLLIPGVNWVVEVLVRWDHALAKKSLIKYLIAIVVTIPSGIVIGWLDALWCVLFGHMVLCD